MFEKLEIIVGCDAAAGSDRELPAALVLWPGYQSVSPLVFICNGSRRAFVAGVSAGPTHERVTQQERNASMQMADLSYGAERIFIDYNKKFPRSFDAVSAEGVKVQRVGPVAPNLNALRRAICTELRAECLTTS